MTTNGTGRRKRLAKDEVVIRKVEIDRVRATLAQVSRYLEPRADKDDEAEELLQRVEFTIFALGRRLAGSPEPSIGAE